MNRMADTVLKKQDEADKELEGKVRRYEEEKERKDKLEEDIRKSK